MITNGIGLIRIIINSSWVDTLNEYLELLFEKSGYVSGQFTLVLVYQKSEANYFKENGKYQKQCSVFWEGEVWRS